MGHPGWAAAGLVSVRVDGRTGALTAVISVLLPIGPIMAHMAHTK